MSDESRAGDEARTDGDAPPTEKYDGPTLGRGELHIPGDDAVLLTDGGATLPRFVYDDESISTGDIVVDLASGKALQVVGKSSQAVGEHPKTRSDDTAAMFGADSEETVFSCVFLPDGEKVRPPTKTYAYPSSRLLRYPVENATDYAGNIQTWLRTAFLDELSDSATENTRLKAAVSKAVRDTYGDDLADTFEELVESKEPEVATDGGHVPGHNPSPNTPTPQPAARTNGGQSQRFPELPDFQRDILITLARSQPTHGQGLRDDLAALRDEDINDGRLYPNLNTLVELGLVEKRENVHDDRSHEYVLTNAGCSSVREHARRLNEAVAALETEVA